MAQHVRGHRPADVGPGRHALDQALDRAGRHAHGIVEGQVPLDQRLHAGRQRDEPALGARAIGTPLAADHEPVILPVEVVFREGRQLRDPEPRIQQGPDHELLLVSPASVGQAVGLIWG